MALTPVQATGLAAIRKAAKLNGVAWQPLAAIAHHESGLDPSSVGDQGTSYGLFQLHRGGALPAGVTQQQASNPFWNANFAARAIKGLGIQGMSTADQIYQISKRFERPADVQGETNDARTWWQQNAAALAGLGAAPTTGSGGAAGVKPTLAQGTDQTGVAPSAPVSPAPDYGFVQRSLGIGAGLAGRAGGLASLAGVAPATNPFASLQSSLLDIQQHPLPVTETNVTPSSPKDKVVPLQGPAAARATTKGLDTAGKKAVALAKSFLNTPYLYGGANPKTGFDCSGLLTYVWGKNGVTIPHNAAAQYQVAKKVPESALEPGDAVFFSGTDGPGITHVGMYVGNGQFIQAPHTGDHVKISSLSDPYYQAHFTSGGKFS
jgi:cell wall-associated NlpC family hydrolase